ncbi:MAG: starch-binding protein [Flammeovirgaceae bacterium]
MKRINYFLLSLVLLLTSLQTPTSAQSVDFREETIYFLLTTRFFDGDPTNNRPTEWSSYPFASEITDPNDVTWRGDFKGLIDKLDYIKDLGFTAIWITPIVQNWSPLDYHGYHAYDFTRVDPRLESPGATFQDLINEIHARDMKIVLDIVTNHAGRYGIKGLAEIKYNTDPTQPWGQDANGNVLQPNPNWEYDGMTTNPDDGLIWSRANLPTMPAPYNQNLAAFNFPSKESYVDTSDPEWYHHSGNGFAQGFDDTTNLYQRALAGDTPDLNTGSQVVRDYLIAAYTTFINMGVDAFRWDTIKHMNKRDVLHFLQAFKAVNPDLFVFGEVAQKRHELHQVQEINPHWYTWEGEVNNSANSGMAVLDFYAEATFHNVFEYGGSFSQVMAAARYDHLYADPSTNLLWLDNHDFGPNNDWNRRYGGTPENLAACMNFMFTWRGIPVVYYGTEMQFKKGAFADIHEAADIQRSIDNTGRAYYGDVMDQAPSHPIYQHIKKLNAIRKAVPALQKGSWRWDGNGGGNGVGYVREAGDSKVVVGLAKDGAVTFNFGGLTNGIYRDAVTGREILVSNGTMNFTVQPASAGIYVLNGPGMIGGNGVGFFEAGVGGPTAPIVSISPAAGHYANDISVSMSATRGQIHYTTDGSNPSASSPVYSSTFTIGTNQTIKAIAIDGNDQSSIVSHTYTFGEITGLKVYFKKPANWNTVNVHYWNNTPAGTLPPSNWPGPSMINEGNDWYSYVFANVTSTNLLFNDNGGSKTDDLFRDRTGWFKDGVWYDSNPDDTTPPPSTDLTIHFKKPTNWNNATIYFWQDNNGNPIPGTNWPGEQMTAEGGDWYVYTISGQECASIIFSDNGANQTADLFRCGEGWYDGQWHNTNPDGNPPPPTGLTVHFKPNTYSNPSIYFWNVTPTGQSTSWPGVSMTAEGDGWYKYTFEDADCANVIFSNNGANQTPDLSRCTEGWYENGQWSDSAPTGRVGMAKTLVAAITANPNPASTQVSFAFYLDREYQASLKVYDLMGNEVGNLMDGTKTIGWHRIQMDTGRFPEGLYIYRFSLNGQMVSKKLMIKR